MYTLGDFLYIFEKLPLRCEKVMRYRIGLPVERKFSPYELEISLQAVIDTYGEKPHTPEEASEEFGITIERVRMIERRALRRKRIIENRAKRRSALLDALDD